mmetsp:Transcript_16452/g.40697  ORF Transcript_16452/g.40697 Transcript_16452/m.40697 type:complete len:294 (+) Transcript_16452:149-1030(+)|eukprot:CAMPEP_0179000068 /NCGR_PEP_ID=MMETSP0795-20121207/10452_1 /TAXON_ID=88552 /ORGANISM="Amoebophrya sp., Strain Ameob2" /LENGTH=293 /DNA_ID=CAMNT_0020692995 /DNA_START=52 /DNA_END=933 /DNA_ORIENTATION=-
MLPAQPGAKAQTVFTPGKKRRINLVAVCMNIFLPWFLFAALFAILSFSFHYQQPAAAWLCVGIGLFVSLGAIGIAFASRGQNRDPSWYLFSGLMLFLAVVLAAIFGDMNFWYNMQPFYDIENLNTYPSVDPATQTGQRLMDAGRVYFADNTRLDTSKAMGFKNLDLYCVAPIVNGNQALETYDFWAVGLNCCSGVSSDFRCGEFNNPHARSGLRLMRDDQRPFFRLAVQQAAAAHHLKSTHPLFFYWLQDPVGEMNSYRDQGFKYYLLGIFTHFAFNLFCTTVAVIGFSRIGK